MGMLTRYQKSGGFMQLLRLIETCEPKKQTKFLEMIENEDLRWARAIREKMLSIERILSWDDLILGEVAVQLPEKVVAVLLHHFGEDVHQRFLKTLSESQKRKINVVFEESKPTPGEINSALIVFVEKVRSLIVEGYIHVDRFDAGLVIESDVEEHLADGSYSFSSSSLEEFSESGMSSSTTKSDLAGKEANSEKAKTSASTAEKPNQVSGDVMQLKKQIFALTTQNQKLADENKLLKDKLEKIRKIA